MRQILNTENDTQGLVKIRWKLQLKENSGWESYPIKGSVLRQYRLSTQTGIMGILNDSAQ